MNRARIVVAAAIALAMLGGIMPAAAQTGGSGGGGSGFSSPGTSDYYSNGNNTNLNNDWNDRSNQVMANDLCVGQFFFGARANFYTANNALGVACPSYGGGAVPGTGTAQIDLYTSSTATVPQNVFYNYIDVFTDEPIGDQWAGNIYVTWATRRNTADIIAYDGSQISTPITPEHVGNNDWEQYRNRIYINRFSNTPWELSFQLNGQCPHDLGGNDLSFSRYTRQHTYLSCPAISEIGINYTVISTNTPSPTVTGTPTPTATPTSIISSTPTISPTATVSPTATYSNTPWAIDIPLNACTKPLFQSRYDDNIYQLGSPSGFYMPPGVTHILNDSVNVNIILLGGDSSTTITAIDAEYGWLAATYPDGRAGISLNGANDTAHIGESGTFQAHADMSINNIPTLESTNTTLGVSVANRATSAYQPPYETTNTQEVHLYSVVISGTGTPLTNNYCGTQTPTLTMTQSPSPTLTVTGTQSPSATPTLTTTRTTTSTPTLTLTPSNTSVYPTNVAGALITPTDDPCNVAAYVFQSSNNLGTPCGVLIAWATLVLPTLDLPSPTLYVIPPTDTAQPITATASLTSTPTINPSLTITTTSGTAMAMLATPTYSIDISAVTGMGTAVSQQFATLMPLAQLSISVSGTPVGLADMGQQAGNGIGQVIIVGRSIAATGFDVGGLITFGLLLIIFIVAVQLFVAILPLILFILRWLLQIIQTILTPF